MGNLAVICFEGREVHLGKDEETFWFWFTLAMTLCYLINTSFWRRSDVNITFSKLELHFSLPIFRVGIVSCIFCNVYFPRSLFCLYRRFDTLSLVRSRSVTMEIARYLQNGFVWRRVSGLKPNRYFDAIVLRWKFCIKRRLEIRLCRLCNALLFFVNVVACTYSNVQKYVSPTNCTTGSVIYTC